jgi:tRNA pseudouridine55 synthase
VDKPAGLTSHDVVQRVRRAYRTRAVGHTGTLDPFATGLLVVLLGRATRLARFVEAQPKTYLATTRLGLATTTDDLEGEPLALPLDAAAVTAAVDRARLGEALANLTGTQRQRPPSFSAKRVGGERSHRLARRGEAMELAETTVTVHGIDLIDYQPPLATFRTTVSAGTYVRALARDLGARLGVGGHLTALRREAIGAIRVEDAVPLEALGPDTPLRAPHEVLGHLPAVELDEAGRRAVAHGRTVRDPSAPPAGHAPAPAEGGGGLVALLHAGRLAAVAASGDGWLRPTVVLEQP